MDRSEFTAAAPGQLVELPDTVAFLPDSLPPVLEVDAELLRAVDSARGAISEFVGQARLVEDINLVMAPLSHREAVLSNRIEGTYTEMPRVLRHEADPTEKPRSGDTELHEVLNYLDALERAVEWVGDARPVSKTVIRALHQKLMQGVRGQTRHPGSVRTGELYIGNHVDGIGRAVFVPPPGQHVEGLLDDLVRFMQEPTAFGPLVDSAIVHYQFETIHPFEDGNGRFGRLLIPVFLVTKGVLDRPILYLSSFFERHRDEYVALLKKVSTQGTWKEWVLFFLAAIQSESNDSRQRVERILSLRADYGARVRSESKAAVLAVDYIMAHPYVSIGRLQRHAGVTYPTAKRAVEALQRLGILLPYQQASGRQLWYAEELIRQVYEVDSPAEG